MANISPNLQYKIVSIWKEFCGLHSELFEATCDEYQLLLESNLDDLEEKVQEKIGILEKIRLEEKKRQGMIDTINETRGEDEKISNVSELIDAMTNAENVKLDYKLFLTKYNALLIDIIERIQEQNRTNQIFLNKAIHNLRTIRNGVSPNKTMVTYGPGGKEIRSKEIR